jgi:hypothetical protein
LWVLIKGILEDGGIIPYVIYLFICKRQDHNDGGKYFFDFRRVFFIIIISWKMCFILNNVFILRIETKYVQKILSLTNMKDCPWRVSKG